MELEILVATNSMFQALAANFFEQRRCHEKIVTELLPKILGEGQKPRDAYEEEALIALASVRYADGNDNILAAHAKTTVVPFEESLVLLKASRRLKKDPNFREQLFNGDARPLIEEALDQAVRTVYSRRKGLNIAH